MTGYQTWEEPAECPGCGGPSVCTRYSDHPEWSYHPRYCAACVRGREQRSAQRSATFRVNFRERFPEVSERTFMSLLRSFSGNGMSWLLAASDDDILEGRNIGPKMLAEFRAVWPVPIADVATDDPWRDHAEMVAGVH